jgi:hypothetical protein
MQQREVERTLEEVDPTEGHYPDDRKIQQYSNLFFLLQSEPRHIAALCRLVSLSEIDTLLQTVMFTLYGNQYESREEHLLLTMFQSVLSAQFETATEFGSLLRANTPVSRMMTTYTRRGPGQSYLKSVLAERINSLIEHKDLNLEINPVKVSFALIFSPDHSYSSIALSGIRANDQPNRGRDGISTAKPSSGCSSRNRSIEPRCPSYHRPAIDDAHGDRE